MATVSLTPGSTSVPVTVTTKLSVIPPQAAQAPGGLYPMRASAWETDEWRIRNGWPVPVPTYDIQIPTLVSATGDTLASRVSPGEVLTNAALRWVADPSYYDEDALRWTPMQGSVPVWQTSVDYAPVLLNNYEYRVGSERFINMYALNFDSDTRNHMWADFSGSIATSNGYTIIMVMSPNSAYGNNVAVPYNGLWCYGQATPDGDTFDEPLPAEYANFTLQGNYVYMETDEVPRQIGVSVSDMLNNTQPTYLAIVVQRPITTLYSATGPSKLLFKPLTAGASQPALSGQVVLGRATGDVLHTADMALFDLGIYANPLTPEDVRNEFATLSQVYGGDS